ncbi:MAG: tetratricopeptide repeat protein [Phycisphaerae bacterium]
MDAGKIFVGRKAELDQFKEVLKDPKGQAVLVVGQAGMGKTWLVNKMAGIAENHPDLKCGWVRYEVTPTDSVDSIMAIMMDNAFEAAQVTEGSFNGTTRRLEQWRSLLNVINIGDLVMSLKRDPAKNTREQFLKRLELISKRMPDNGRSIFVIDPEKYMQMDSDQAWAIVVKELPDKIKFIFAQRPEDVLVEGETFGALDNVSQIPEERLDILDEESVDELINKRVAGLKYSVKEVREVLNRYEGHPYALQGSLDLLKAGMELEELPESPEPTKFAQVQWSKVCNSSDGAIELLEAYAVLEVGVPDDVVEGVSGLKSSKLRKLLADKYLAGLLRDEGEGKRIYHAILADYVVEQIGEAERKDYHSGAVKVYRGKLARAEEEQIKPDALAATRLAEHVLAAEGKETFVYAFANECGKALMNLGLIDTFISLSERALGMVEKESEGEAAVLGNLGLICRERGELDKAGEMHKRSLEIAEKIGWLEGMAGDYCNLGLIYRRQGELDKAEDMHLKSLELAEKLGLQEMMANGYGNLGLIYEIRGELYKAEEMHKRSLEIAEKLVCLEGMASVYGNLGNIYCTRGELDKAEEMHLKSLEIEKKLGRLEGMAADYGNLGLIYEKRGELDKAEEMYKKALDINNKIGRLEGQAIQYHNLASVYKQRGDVAKAKEYWEKALELYKRIGMPHEVEKVEGWIEGIDN